MKLWAVLVIAACTQSTAMNVAGTVTDTFITPAGKVTRPRDLSAYTFQAFVLGSDGAYVAHPEVAVHGGSDGHFEIADVPIGPYLLVENGSFWSTETASEIVRTYTWIGRTDAVPATQTTWLGLTGSALSAWKPNDALLADCWGNGTEMSVAQMLSIGSGATLLDGAIEWNAANGELFQYSYGPTFEPYLINADKGDTLVVSHGTAASIGPTTTALTLTQIMNAPGVDQIDGGSAMTGGSFVDVPMTSQIELAIDPSEFAAAFGSGSAGYTIGVVATPAVSSNGEMGPNLVGINGGSDRIDVTLPFGDPFDPTWPVFVYALYNQEVPHGAASSELVPLTASYTFHPVAAATQLELDDTPLDQGDVAWDGMSPLTLSLALPDGATGFDFSLSDTASVSSEASFSVEGSSVAIPPTLFVAGHSYDARIYTQTTATAGASVSIGPFVVGTAQPK